MKKLIIFLVVAIFASGCAAKKPYEFDPGKSYALNVMRAGGANYIKDIPREKFEEHGEAALAGRVRGNESGLGGTLLATWSGGLLFGASYWAVGEKAPESRSAIMAWMPIDEASNEEAAYLKVATLIGSALEDAILEIGLPEGYFLERVQAVPPAYKVLGNDCSQDKVFCGFEVTRLIGKASNYPTKGHAPDFLGGGPAWVFSFEKNNYLPFGFGTFRKGEFLAKFPDFEIFQRMSAKLPRWVAVYLAPVGAHSHVSFYNNGSYIFLDYPVILHEGKNLEFIGP